MSLTISYKGVDIVDETADCNKTLKTAGQYCEADIGVEYTSEAPTLISKSITANGNYSASADGADGYSSVSVNVADQLVKLCTGTATYVKISDANIPTCYIFPEQNRNCAYFSIKNRNADWFVTHSFRGFAQNTTKSFLNLANAIDIIVGILWDAKADTVVLTSTAVNRLTGSLQVERNSAIYVRDSLLSGYKSASNWAAYGDVLKGYSEAPVYDGVTTWGIGDVCQYNGKFYSYCKSDLTSSAGNAPSGTTDDNDYWEYLAEVGS